MKYWSPYSSCLIAISTAYFTMTHNQIFYTCTLQTDTEPIYRTVHTVCSTYHIIKKYSSNFSNISFFEWFFMYTAYCFFRAVFLYNVFVRLLLSWLQKAKKQLQVLNSFLGCSSSFFIFFCLFWSFTAFFGWKTYLLQFFTFFSNMLHFIYSFTAAVLTLSVVLA